MRGPWAQLTSRDGGRKATVPSWTGLGALALASPRTAVLTPSSGLGASCAGRLLVIPGPCPPASRRLGRLKGGPQLPSRSIVGTGVRTLVAQTHRILRQVRPAANGASTLRPHRDMSTPQRQCGEIGSAGGCCRAQRTGNRSVASSFSACSSSRE
ncbi:hypothetical protein PSPO01_02647 [Paraphaeosphaeria sporulosa]